MVDRAKYLMHNGQTGQMVIKHFNCTLAGIWAGTLCQFSGGLKASSSTFNRGFNKLWLSLTSPSERHSGPHLDYADITGAAAILPFHLESMV